MPWRWPRILAALIAGVMLAVAGCIIQRLTGNPMASPEVLGISSGAAFGVVLMLFLVPGNAFGWLLPAGSLGAAATLLIIMIAAGRGGFSPHRMLLAGMALSTAFTMLLMMLQASGDPRMAGVLTWISGSTYNASGEQVLRTGIVMVILLALTPLCRRWLTILPLGGDTARAVGMAITPSRVGYCCWRQGDGDSHHDHWTVELCRADGAAYCPYDGFSSGDAAYADFGVGGWRVAGLC
ncbi:Ferrichrome transport system permease protein fhuB [Citrobacter portucalensis]|nr:Ferrichrome transport system permease protein fhuB [Citrobacter portucalensis]